MCCGALCFKPDLFRFYLGRGKQKTTEIATLIFFRAPYFALAIASASARPNSLSQFFRT